MLESTIKKIKARKILDSRGNPTIEIDLFSRNASARASAPAGASTSSYEAKPFPAGGIGESLEMIKSEISQELLGMNSKDQKAIDEMLKAIDGTKYFSRIGGSTAIAISMAAAKLAAASQGKPLYAHLGTKRVLPFPLSKMLGGGKHAGSASPDIQEFLACPIGAKTMDQALQANTMLHHRLRQAIPKKDKNFAGGRDDEGGWAASLKNRQALDILKEEKEAVESALKIKMALGLDMAASSLYDEKKKRYIYAKDCAELSAKQQMEHVLELIEEYKLFYVEDPFHENDSGSFAKLTAKAGHTLICGDDIFATNPELLEKGISLKACNSVIIKPNQAGTVTDTVNAIDIAKKNGYVPIVSHRSGETEETFIAHLAVAFACPMLKTSTSGGERLAKLNELTRIGEDDIKLGVI